MDRVLSLDAAIQFRQEQKLAGKIVVFTNGLFDLFHIGHLDYLERARNLGDTLIIGLNSDASARALKGKSRPIFPQEERARLLAALQVVDAVVLFEEMTATNLILALKPDIYVKGGDYAQKDWPEKQTAIAMGCRLELLPYLEGYSSSQTIKAILDRFQDGSVD